MSGDKFEIRERDAMTMVRLKLIEMLAADTIELISIRQEPGVYGVTTIVEILSEPSPEFQEARRQK